MRRAYEMKVRAKRWKKVVELAMEKTKATNPHAFHVETGYAASAIRRWLNLDNTGGMDPDNIKLGTVNKICEKAEVTPDQFRRYMETGQFCSPKEQAQLSIQE